ncbi:hypothetical protein [Phenylobacterium sp.]|uniref:hypothetical protein n=1 Tax=Phenylobacterium sp. TaxID=1871053 RepID=UPI003563A8AD
MNRRLFVFAALALGGCATLAPPPAAPRGPLAELEPLYSAVAGKDGLTIRVASNGCTRKADFTFYVERRPESATLAFARKRVDMCRSFVMGRQEIVFPWSELGVDPRAQFFLLNPLTAWTGPGT